MTQPTLASASRDAAHAGAQAVKTDVDEAVTGIVRAADDGLKAPPRKPAEIEADLAVTRERLAANVAQLKAYVSPKNVVERQVDKVKGIYVDEQGGVRIERVAATAAAVIGVALLTRALFRSRRG